MRRAVSLLLLAAVSPAQESRPAIGDDIGQLELTDIRYLRRSLADFGKKKGFVLFFVTNECPLVLRYLPVVEKLAKRYSDKGIQFAAVNVGPDDTILEMAACAVEHGISIPFVKDTSGRVPRTTGVDRTATAVVLTADRRLHYRGRVDSRYRFGGASPAAGREDLALALDDLLAGRAARVARTPVEGCAITPATQPKGEGLTWTKHIAPLVQRHCQDCHRPDGEAPFELLTYRDMRKRGRMIAEVVRQRRMPPWFGSRKHGDFANERGMTDAEIDAMTGWVTAGMPEGDAKDLPAPRVFEKRTWRIGEPDLVLKIPTTIRIPAEGYVPYKYFIFPYRFREDTWVERIEILPENRKVLHHANIVHVAGTSYRNSGFITGQVPGGDPMVLDPGTALKIPAGRAILIQCHYVPTGKREVDRLRIGLRFPRTKVRKRLRHLRLGQLRFEIPPHASHHRVTRTKRLQFDAEGLGMFAHMHLRGKAMTFRATAPDGAEETLLVVPNYSFDWQQSYRWKPGTRFFAKGTAIRVDGFYDNSAFNPYNPNPDRVVPYGLRTTDEMMFGFLFYFRRNEDLNLRVDPKTGHVLD